MAIDQSEILKKAVDKLRDDADLLTLLGETETGSGKARVYNHVPQDKTKPYLVVVWVAESDWDTKSNDGYSGSLSHQAVSIHHSDRDNLQVLDRVRALYRESPIVLTNGHIVCFDYRNGSVDNNVLETHKATAVFSVLVED